MSDSRRKFSTLDLQDVVNAIATHGGYSGKTAAILDATPAEVAQAASEAHRLGIKPDAEALAEKEQRLAGKKVNKLENNGFTKAEIIEEIQRLQEDHGYVSSRVFENSSEIDISVLQGLFGTWAEAARQAGIKPSTEEARAQRALAKIAAAERYNPVLEKIRAAGNAYDRPTNAKEKRLIVVSDTHDLYMDPLIRRAIVSEAATGDYHGTILNGDIYDFYEVSKYGKTPQWVNLAAARDYNRQFFYELRDAMPDGQIDLIEGNHEYRMIKKCIEIPEMAETLGLTGFDLPRLFRLDDLEINYVGEKDFRTPDKPTWVRDPAAPQGKFYYNAFFATHLPNFHKNAGVPGTHGHVHKFTAIQKYSLLFGNHHWWVTGAGCIRKAEYARGGTMLWNSGFLTVIINSSKDPAIVKCQWHQADDDIRVNGRTYTRRPDEQVGSDDVVEYNRKLSR